MKTINNNHKPSSKLLGRYGPYRIVNSRFISPNLTWKPLRKNCKPLSKSLGRFGPFKGISIMGLFHKIYYEDH